MNRIAANVRLLFLGILILAMPTAASARERATYRFQTQIVPVEHVSTDFRLAQGDVWARGLLLPDRVVRLRGRPSIDHEGVTLPDDEAFGLAYTTNGSVIACSIEQVMKFRMGRSHICLIDVNGDGLLDGWFRRGDEIVIAHGSRPIPDDIRVIEPIGFEEVMEDELSSLRTHSGFVVLRKSRQLDFCRTYNGGIETFCISEVAKWGKGQTTGIVRFLDGVFEYRAANDEIEVRLLNSISRQPFITGNH